jgi:hypothetical protein
MARRAGDERNEGAEDGRKGREGFVFVVSQSKRTIRRDHVCVVDPTDLGLCNGLHVFHDFIRNGRVALGPTVRSRLDPRADLLSRSLHRPVAN